jgi:hypothetical protein
MGVFYSALRAQKNTLSRLREAMGLTPKSERGSQLSCEQEEQTTFALENLSPAQKELLAVLEAKRALVQKEKRDYDKQILALKPKVKEPRQLEFALASEMMFCEPASFRQ